MRTWWKRGKKPYEPTEAQWPIHLAPHRFILVAGGERGGKSITAAKFVEPRLLDSELVWIIAADYELCRPEFNYIRDDLSSMGLIRSISDPSGRYLPRTIVTKTNCIIQTLTAAEEKRIAAQAPDVVVLAEAAQLNLEIWERARGRVAQKRGVVFLEGTFEDAEPWYDDLWQKWLGGLDTGHISFSLPSWTNTVVYPGGMDDPEIQSLKETQSEERFNARHGGVPTPPRDLVHPEFSYATHAKQIEYDPRLRVWLAVDPGYRGAYAVNAIQIRGVGTDATVNVIDEVYVRQHQAREVIYLCEQRPWISNVDPGFAGVMDIAGGQHHGNESQLEIWREAGYAFATTPVSIPDGIERMRTFLKDPRKNEPRIFYNSVTCVDSMKEYRRYRYPKGKDGKPEKDKPIDSNNHSIKALTYFLVKMFGVAAKRNQRAVKRPYKYGKSAEDMSNGPFGPYPGNVRPAREARPYAERWMDRHERWRKTASNRVTTPRTTTNPSFRFKSTR